ncbi:MAG: hypothetical protein FD122_3745 [Stygiobacter sp.]|nr:MAG: hypothetical protein FD122_3745 [Stygiobacter sp.]
MKTEAGLGGPEMMDLIKNGIQMIVNQTKIGNKNMQMGIMEYSNEVKKPLGFGENQDMHGVAEASRGMNTSGAPPARHDLAVKEVENMFGAARPRKEAVPRVAVFIITKKSPTPLLTMEAAKRLDAQGGGISRFVFVTDPKLGADPEVLALASRPACNHIFKLRHPSEIVARLDELNEEAARVPVPMSDSYSKNSTIQCTLHGERRQVQEKVDPAKGRKFVLRVRGGNVTVYVSRTEPEPSAENHEYSAHATDGQNAEITVSSADMQNVNRQEFQRSRLLLRRGARVPARADDAYEDNCKAATDRRREGLWRRRRHVGCTTRCARGPLRAADSRLLLLLNLSSSPHHFRSASR